MALFVTLAGADALLIGIIPVIPARQEETKPHTGELVTSLPEGSHATPIRNNGLLVASWEVYGSYPPPNCTSVNGC